MLGKLLVGKRVALLNGINGNWQERTTVLAKQAVPLPKSLPAEQGATFFVNPTTAFAMTRRVLAVPSGDWLLQDGGSRSELGKMIVRLGKRFGFKTLNVVRRAEQAEALKSLGANAVVVFRSRPATRRRFAERSASNYWRTRRAIRDDPVGGATGSAVVKCLAPGGRMLVYGTLSPEPLSFSPRDLMTPGASIEGFWLARWLPQLCLIAKLKLIRTVSGMISRGCADSQIGEVFPLDRVQRRRSRGGSTGTDGKSSAAYRCRLNGTSNHDVLRRRTASTSASCSGVLTPIASSIVSFGGRDQAMAFGFENRGNVGQVVLALAVVRSNLSECLETASAVEGVAGRC